MIRRREFITLLGGAAARPLAARAQQPATPVIGFLSTGSRDSDVIRLTGFRQGLNEMGFVEGRNAMITYRWAEGQDDRLPALAADLVRRHVSVIAAAGGIDATIAAKATTTAIPIVFFVGADPVTSGLVASLNRPGANVTGVTSLGVELGPKRLELMHDLLPTATIIAALVNPANPMIAEPDTRSLQAAGHALGLQIHILHASSERDFDTVFATLLQLRASALVIGNDALFNSHQEQLAVLAVRHAVPTIYQYPAFAAAGGLMSYGGSFTDSYRQIGVYTGRILKGEKPSELPVMQSTKVELIINLKTARALGITVPISLLGRADEVIE
jgi:putative ABC transport system substrate-binding protein